MTDPRTDRLAPGTHAPQRMLDRILTTPNIEQIVPRLKPEVLHQVIQSCGLEDCGEFVALATPEQLARVFDVDLWRAAQPGHDEQLDPDRFGVWLEVMAEHDVNVAVQKLSAMDAALVVAALAQHVRVFDYAALSTMEIDGEAVTPIRGLDRELQCAVGGYLVVARRTESWDAIVSVLLSLDAQHQEYFHRVMSGCRHLSDSGREIDGLDDLLTDDRQLAFDVALAREQRRETQGYVTPAQARGFLEMSRQQPRAHESAPSGDAISRAYFRVLQDAREDARAADVNGEAHGLLSTPDVSPEPDDADGEVGSLINAFVDAGILRPEPRALLEGSRDEASRLARIQWHMQWVGDRDQATYSLRNQELAYLANTIVAGCSRLVSPQDAPGAAIAVCNLGLENWPGGSLALPDDFLLHHDLVRGFQIGWAVLYEQVVMYSAERLIAVLAGVDCHDRAIQRGVDALRAALQRHWKAGAPWRARNQMDVLASLDLPAWAALLGVIDELPVLHQAIRASRDPRMHTVDAAAFEFISERNQIAAIHEFMHSLPDMLQP